MFIGIVWECVIKSAEIARFHKTFELKTAHATSIDTNHRINTFTYDINRKLCRQMIYMRHYRIRHSKNYTFRYYKYASSMGKYLYTNAYGCDTYSYLSYILRDNN